MGVAGSTTMRAMPIHALGDSERGTWRGRYVVAALVVLLPVACRDADQGSESVVPTTTTTSRAKTAAPQDARLSVAKQKHIWAVEHAAFELETFFGKPLAAALATDDEARLTAFFRDEFSGTGLSATGLGDTGSGDTAEQRVEHGTLAEVTRARAESAVPLPRNSFLRELRSSVEFVGQSASIRMRVLHLDRDADDPDIWRSRWRLRASCSAEDGSARQLESHHAIAFRFANDAAIRSGPIVTAWSIERDARRVSTAPLMREVTRAFGLADLPLHDNWNEDVADRRQYTFQIAVADYDRDGFPDIAIATADGAPLLLHNERGRGFRDVTAAFGLEPWWNDWSLGGTMLASWIDVDDDGFPDLILGRTLFRNVNGDAFEDVRRASGLRFRTEPMGCVVADYDADGDCDLYVLYQTGKDVGPGATQWVGEENNGGTNVLWRNDGAGHFTDVTEQSGAAGGARRSFAAAWLYADDDAILDLYVANDFGDNVLLRGRGDGSFEDMTASGLIADFATSMGVTAGDLDNDGRTELYVANMFSKMGRRVLAHVGPEDYPPGLYDALLGSCAGNRLYRLRPPSAEDAGYDEVSSALGVNGVGWAYAPAMLDIDGDGFLDLYAATGFMSNERSKPDG